MDYSLIYFDYDRLKQKFGAEKMSEMLREAIYLFSPDILFYFHYEDWISHKVFEEISKELPTKTVIFLADDHWRYGKTKPVWQIFNLICVTDQEGITKRHNEGFHNTLLTQWGCNHHLFRNLNLPKQYDVTFVGRSYGKRADFVNALKNQGVDVRTFGQGWPNSGRVSQSELINIYNRSKITLNISFASTGTRTQIKGRDFEAVGCGSLLLTRESSGIENYFVPGEEIVTYSDVEDAIKKLKYYLNNEEERVRIAQRGLERLLHEHTMEKRITDILNSADRVSKPTKSSQANNRVL